MQLLSTPRRGPLRRCICQLEHKVEFTGRPGIIHGLTSASGLRRRRRACLLPGVDAIGHIYHDDHFELLAASHVAAHPLDEGEERAMPTYDASAQTSSRRGSLDA